MDTKKQFKMRTVKVFFDELTFNKVGTYKYKITEKAGSDAAR